jgi:hypothetical protein
MSFSSGFAQQAVPNTRIGIPDTTLPPTGPLNSVVDAAVSGNQSAPADHGAQDPSRGAKQFVVAPIPVATQALGVGAVPVAMYVFQADADKSSPPSTVGGFGLISSSTVRQCPNTAARPFICHQPPKKSVRQSALQWSPRGPTPNEFTRYFSPTVKHTAADLTPASSVSVHNMLHHRESKTRALDAIGSSLSSANKLSETPLLVPRAATIHFSDRPRTKRS